VAVIDIFRFIDSLEDQYDVALLEGPEEILAGYVSSEAAKAIVSDALLVAFALVRQRTQPLYYQATKSRCGSLDEYCLISLIGSSRTPDSELAFEAATALGVTSVDFMTSLTSDLVRQIDAADLSFDTPSLADFRAIVGHRLFLEDGLDESASPSEMKFLF
jgi:hypothetical protein